MNKSTFVIDYKSHLRHLWSLLFFGLIFPIMGYYFALYKLETQSFNEARLIVIGISALFIIPVIIIHLNHLNHNWKSKFLIRKDDEFIYTKGQSSIVFLVEEIKSLTSIKSWPLAEERPPTFPWDIYHYSIIELVDGRIIKISSLLVYNSEKLIPSKETTIKRTFFTWIT